MSSSVYAELASTVSSMSGNSARTADSRSTSQPGSIFSLIRL